MIRNKLYRITSTLLLAAVLMTACAPAQLVGPTAVPAGPTLPGISPSSTPDPSETPGATSTDTTSSSVTVTGVPSNPLLPTGETPSSDHSQVTLADNGTSITLHVGQSFLLNLGDQYDWNINVADQTVLSRVKYIAVIRGAQGVYQALKAGNTTLMAGGDPPCRKSNPPCMRPSIVFQISLVVEP